MNNDTTPDLWHGLTYGAWLRLWNDRSWTVAITNALAEVAWARDASHDDRLMAIQTLNEAILNEALPPDPQYPKMVRDVLLEIVMQGESRRWFGGRARRRFHARLMGAKWMLKTAYQFLEYTKYEANKAKAVATIALKPTELLS
jgi:hypothetical protein